MVLSGVIGFQLCSKDNCQAYLESAEKLLRDVYINPGKEVDLQPNQILKLLRPLYGLSDSDDYWGATFNKRLTEDIGMNATTTDDYSSSNELWRKEQTLAATYVDDALQARDEIFQSLADQTEAIPVVRPDL